jgi:hypothetical protein
MGVLGDLYQRVAFLCGPERVLDALDEALRLSHIPSVREKQQWFVNFAVIRLGVKPD